MLRVPLAFLLTFLIAACTSSVPREMQTPAAVQGEPIIAHLVIGGVT